MGVRLRTPGEVRFTVELIPISLPYVHYAVLHQDDVLQRR